MVWCSGRSVLEKHRLVDFSGHLGMLPCLPAVPKPLQAQTEVLLHLLHRVSLLLLTVQAIVSEWSCVLVSL